MGFYRREPRFSSRDTRRFSPYSAVTLDNWDTLTGRGCDENWINYHPNVPQGPARVVVSGRSGGGKTNSVLSIIDKYVRPDQLWIYARVPGENKYNYLEEKFEGDDRFFLSDDLGDLPDCNEISKDLRTVIIIDDFDLKKDSKEEQHVRNLFKTCRKTNTSVYFIGHDYHRIPPGIRSQANYAFIYMPESRRALRTLHESVAPPGMTFGEFEDLFDNEIAQARDNQNFLFIEYTPQGTRNYRIGLNTPLSV